MAAWFCFQINIDEGLSKSGMLKTVLQKRLKDHRDVQTITDVLGLSELTENASWYRGNSKCKWLNVCRVQIPFFPAPLTVLDKSCVHFCSVGRTSFPMASLSRPRDVWPLHWPLTTPGYRMGTAAKTYGSVTVVEISVCVGTSFFEMKDDCRHMYLHKQAVISPSGRWEFRHRATSSWTSFWRRNTATVTPSLTVHLPSDSHVVEGVCKFAAVLSLPRVILPPAGIEHQSLRFSVMFLSLL